MTTTLPEPFTVNGRYEITERPLGEGGMGVIYKAYDVVTKRFVALKTLWADATPATIQLFEREWTVLSRLSHPNIVDILDTGDSLFSGQRRPYFVMPLLPGRTLEELIQYSGQRLSVERAVDIISQACRGLQAAHDQNLVHRDIKPSNIFVMDDDTVKIIDFGVVYLADGQNAMTSLRGTPVYMAPEQLEMKSATPLSDIYSLATVCYETLTGRKAFAGATATEIADAVRYSIPPPASEVNPAVNQVVSRTVHKAMARQPWHRFANAREFGDTLQRALRNDPIERFERTKILPRIERVRKAYGEGDYQFALEILRELESEGHVDPDMSTLHIQIDQALRQKQVHHLLENARIRMDEEEFPLALNKVEDALAIEPGNREAQALKEQIEKQRDSTQLSHWFRLVREHLDHNLFGQARQGLQEILKIDSSNTEAREMLAHIDQTEQDILKNREEKQRLYENAVESYRKGEISTALNHLERALAIARRSARSSSPDLDAQCQTFYDSIRGERDSAQSAYREGRSFLTERKVSQTLAICDEYLRKHPGDARFQALKLEAEEFQRHVQSAAIAEVSRRVDDEPDLDKKHQILQNAIEAHPDEPHFRSALKLIADRRDLVNAIVARARQYEERRQFADAAGEMDILRNIYPLFPGLDAEMERLAQRKEEQIQLEAKAGWIEQIDSHLNAAEYDKALAVLSEGLAAFPGDNDLLQRKSLTEQGVTRSAEASRLLKEGKDLCTARNFDAGLTFLRKAERLDPRNRLARAALLSGLVSYARELMPSDWHAAEPVVTEALDLEPSDPVARSLLAVLDDNRRQSAINIILAGARNYQSDGHIADALQIIERGLVQYPNDHRLIQFFTTLRAQGAPAQSSAKRTIGSAPPVDLQDTVPAMNGSPVDAVEATQIAQGAQNPPQQKFFAPPNTDIPFNGPAEDQRGDGGESEMPVSAPKLEKAIMNRPTRSVRRPEPTRVRSIAPVPPKDPGLGEELSFKGPLWIVAAVTAIVLILAAGVYQVLRDKTKPPMTIMPAKLADARTKNNGSASPRYPVSFESNVPGTRFTEGDQILEATAQLAPGNHNVEAFHEGYLSDAKSFTVDPGATSTIGVKFELRPILPTLRLNSSIAHGQIVVDHLPPLDLQSGAASMEDLSLGSHTVKIFDGPRLVFAFSFEVEANEIPTLVAPLANQTVPGVVVASLAGSAKVYASADVRAAVALPVAMVPSAGLEISGSPANPAHFFVDTGKGNGPQQQSVDPSVLPTLLVQLAESVDPSALSITTNATNCKVSVDGKQLSGAALAIPLTPGNHPVKLSCPGFQDMEKVAVVKGREVNPHTLDFAMTPIPVLSTTVAAPAPPTPAIPVAPSPARRAQLILSGAPPEASVFQNQVRIGTVAADGTFAREVDPGTFTWEWRKANFEPRRETRTVKAGEPVRIDGAMLASATGGLLLKVVPETAHIAVNRLSDNTSISASNNVVLPLAAGAYQVSAQAPDYQGKSELVQITSGNPVKLNWDLERTPVVSGLSRFFENGDSWHPFEEESGWWIHPGVDYSTLRATTGSINIDFLRKKRSKKINLLADCRDRANCIIYSMDGHNFTARVIANGETIADEKKAHGMDNNPSFQLTFELSPEKIVVKNQAGTTLSSVDRQDAHGKLLVQNENPLKIN